MRDNDIVFFNLHRRYLNHYSRFGGFLGIFSLAAFLNENGYLAQSFAGTLAEGKKLLDYILQNKKASIIGLYCDYENITENIYLSNYVKQTSNIPIIVGGPQVTALNEVFLKKSKCDVLVRYEGELTVLELVNYFLDGSGSLERIAGIAYLNNCVLRINPERPVIENLDMLPMIEDSCYLQEHRWSNELSIMTGRGCPFHCAFCHEGHHTRKVRFRSVTSVLNEIEMFLKSRINARSLFVLFTDDTFTLIPHRVKKMCEGIQKLRQIKEFRWFCEAHVHMLYTHPEMIDYMAKAGVHRLQVGIEAGTQEVLDAYRKGSTISEISKVVELCREAGIPQVYSNIILGGALYNKEIFIKNVEFAKRMLTLGKGCLEIGVVSYWPLPETSITLQPDKYGIKIIDYDFYTSLGDYPQTETNDIDRWELMRMMKDMEKEIKNHMKDMLLRREVSQKRILGWFPEADELKSVGKWWECLAGCPQLLNYHQMTLLGEAYSEEEIEKYSGDRLLLQPMRTVPIYMYSKVQSADELEMFNCCLRGIERDVLTYCTGKLSVNEIVGQITKRFPGMTTEHLRDTVINTVEKLRQHFLITYVKY